MKLSYKFLIILLLTVLIKDSCYTQTMVRKTIDAPLVSGSVFINLEYDIFQLREKIKLKGYEIEILKQLGKIDSLRYGKDSLIVLYTATNGNPLMRITQKFYIPRNQRKYDDSIVVYYNKNGLIKYQELWHIHEKQKRPLSQDSTREKTKLTNRRYEYDDQNRLTRYLVNYPTPRTMEFTYTYDSFGKQTKSGHPIHRTEFWD